MSVRRISAAELEQVRERFQGQEALRNYVREIAEYWPDARMNTREGRKFHYIDDALLGSIPQRILARGYRLSSKDIDWLERSVRAAIIELGCKDAPMIFGSSDAGIDAWVEMHRLSGATMSAEDCERLGIQPDNDE